MKTQSKSKSSKRIITIVLLSLLAALILWTVWGNLTISTTYIEFQDGALPQSFNGLKIAHISDLHNASFGSDNSALISILRQESPDIIVITGDMIDSRHTDVEVAVNFAEQAVKIAPCYYVTGNHESRADESYKQLEARLTACGVEVLRNRSVLLERGGDVIEIAGIDDPAFLDEGYTDSVIEYEIESLGEAKGYRILLSHRPEAFDVYVENGVNLVFSGHAHGGQFRFPLIGALVAPGQGFFPKYDAGLFREGNTAMVVSRGIGNSIIPFRINNRPEVVIVTLLGG